MTIYDCFSFFNELDLLEIRLNTLEKVIDKFVLSESNYTHTGSPKPLYYEENKERFSKFADRIIHVISPDPRDPDRAKKDMAYSWLCENIQRNATIVDDAYLRSVRFKRIAAYLKWIVRPLAWKLIPKTLAMRLSRRFDRI